MTFFPVQLLGRFPLNGLYTVYIFLKVQESTARVFPLSATENGTICENYKTNLRIVNEYFAFMLDHVQCCLYVVNKFTNVRILRNTF